MVKFVVQLLVGWFIIFPIITLLHELGHCIAALIATQNRDVQCVLGTDPNRSKFTLRVGQRLKILLKFGTGFFGIFLVEHSQTLTKNQTIFINLAGPLVSLMIFLIFFLLPSSDKIIINTIVPIFWNGAIYQLLFTLIPMRYPQWMGGYGGISSDGLRIWHAVKDGVGQ
ncbi:MAG: hypothetical protein GY943_22665 [Chloroflexi bacterium]|nr:hypothetical protein [Chloroflexota bacterium]